MKRIFTMLGVLMLNGCASYESTTEEAAVAEHECLRPMTDCIEVSGDVAADDQPLLVDLCAANYVRCALPDPGYEDVGEAAGALEIHDSQTGIQRVDEKCLEKCRATLRNCVAACRTLPPEARSSCYAECTSGHEDCTRMCGSGGCGTPRIWWTR